MANVRKFGAGRLGEFERALAEDDEAALFDLDEEVGWLVFEELRQGRWEDLSEARRLYMACRQLTLEVNNGGVNQFMSNWGPEVVLDAVAFLERRGIVDGVKLLRRAIAALPGGVLPETHTQLDGALLAEGVEDAHERIDDELWDLELDEDLVRERVEFVVEHSEAFFE